MDVSQELIIRESDCSVNEGGEIPGMYVKAFADGREEIESLEERITVGSPARRSATQRAM